MKIRLSLVLMLAFIATSTFAKEGIYIEFKMTGSKFSGTSKTYSMDGNTRSEMTMTSPAMPAPFTTTSLVLHSTPDVVYSISEKDKTYSELATGTGKSQHKADESDYEVTVIGKEKVNNYDAIHVKVRYKSSKQETEMWLSKEVIGWANFTEIKNQYLAGSKFFDALKAKGAEGFVVRILVNSAGENMQMDLVKAEKKDMKESLFSLDGYTKTARAAGPGGMDMEAFKKMSPEERQKYIKELQEKYQQPQH